MKINIVRCKTSELIITLDCNSLDEACSWSKKVGYEDGDVDFFFATQKDYEEYMTAAARGKKNV